MLPKPQHLLFVCCMAIACSCKTKNEEQQNSPINNSAVHLSKKNLLTAETEMMNRLLDDGSAPMQTFIVQSKKTTCITGKKGLKIYVDPQKLCKSDGSLVTEEIKVQIKELTNTDEMMAAGATTISDGKMLISGGSYYIGMESGGSSLQIKNNQGLQIQLPNQKKSGMQLFYGERKADGLLNWQPVATSFTPLPNYTTSSYRSYNSSTLKKVGDSIGKRPALFEECYKIYKDSVFKARCAYTIANRDKLTYQQEMKYILQPIDFPSKRFELMRVDNSPYWNCNAFSRNQRNLSRMYMVTDTFPVYKEFKNALNDESTAEERMDYYAPVEINSLGWINCDRFTEIPICTENKIQLNSNGWSMCRVYFKFSAINSLLAEQVIIQNPSISEFKIQTGLPVGEKVEIIVMAIRNGKVQTDRKKLTIGTNNQWQFTLKDALQKTGKGNV